MIGKNSPVHNGTDTRLAAWQHRSRPRHRGTRHMLFIGIGAALLALWLTARMWVRRGVQAADLGWMSEQWLAQHRASPPL